MSIDGTYRSLSRITRLVSGVTLLVYVATAIRELLFVYSFGTSNGADALLAAFSIPLFAVSVFGNSLQTATVPLFVATHKCDLTDVLAGITGATIALMITVALLIGLASSTIADYIASGLSSENRETTALLLCLLSPIIVLRSLSKVLGGILNANGYYVTAALAPISAPLLVSVWVLATFRTPDARGVAVATLSGAVLELWYLSWSLKRLNLWARPRILWQPSFTKAAHQFCVTAAATMLMAFTNLIDVGFASRVAGDGGVAVFTYATFGVIFLQQIVTIAVASACYPAFSLLYSQDNYVGLWRLARVYATNLCLVGVALTAAIVSLGPVLLPFILARGRLSGSNAALIADVQSTYAWQVPMFIVHAVLLRLLASLDLRSTQLVGAVLFLTVHVVAALALIPRWELHGLAMSSSATYLLVVTYYGIAIRKRLTTSRLRTECSA